MMRFFDVASSSILLLLLCGIPLYGFIKGVKVYAAFVEGAREGFNLAVRVIPYLVAILAAMGAFRASGLMDSIAHVLQPVLTPLGMPVEVLPIALVRPLSGSGANGLLTSVFTSAGPDSYAGRLASILVGSSETTFYVLSVYCGAVNIVRYRHALAAGLLTDAAGLVASICIARAFWG